jgi:beta-galactosidase/beta-glucuronidase
MQLSCRHPCCRDWAPYTNTKQDGIPTFTKGIWKSVSLVQVGAAAITDVVPQIIYAGEYPVTPLTDTTHGGFDVSVRVHTWAAKPTKGSLTITGGWGGAPVTQQVSVAAGNTSTTVKLPTAKNVKLWWPAGHGAQPLYNLSVVFTPSGQQAETAAAAAVSAERRVGFRFFALVTGNDTDPSYVAASKGADGTEKLGMLWRINGAAIFSKGGPDRLPPVCLWGAAVAARLTGWVVDAYLQAPI